MPCWRPSTCQLRRCSRPLRRIRTSHRSLPISCPWPSRPDRSAIEPRRGLAAEALPAPGGDLDVDGVDRGPARTRLAFMADGSHGPGMTTTKGIEMTTEKANFET